MNDLICEKLKEIVNLQNIIKKMSQTINQSIEKFIIFIEYSSPFVFKRYT